jgi:hypothetical protein
VFKKNVALHFEGVVECAICYSCVSPITDSCQRLTKPQDHLAHRPDAADQTLPNVQEPVPRELPLQVVQLVTLVELSAMSNTVLIFHIAWWRIVVFSILRIVWWGSNCSGRSMHGII